jgi:hypothetical protein
MLPVRAELAVRFFKGAIWTNAFSLNRWSNLNFKSCRLGIIRTRSLSETSPFNESPQPW